MFAKKTTFWGQKATGDNKLVLEYIDWKDSYFYRQLIVRGKDDSAKWEDEHLISDHETEHLHKLIRGYRFKKSTFKIEDMVKVLPIMTKKCYSSIEMVYKEILTETYWKKEYD